MAAKSITKCLILFLLIITTLAGCSGPKSDLNDTDDSNTSFALYFVKELNNDEASKIDINELPLEDKPIITNSDEGQYIWDDTYLGINKEVFKNRSKFMYKPFVLVVNNKRVFQGVFFSNSSSMLCPPNGVFIDTPGSEYLRLPIEKKLEILRTKRTVIKGDKRVFYVFKDCRCYM
ncbi:MAG: hypothetical protein ACOYWZ_06725 [Bacillota bacterium]